MKHFYRKFQNKTTASAISACLNSGSVLVCSALFDGKWGETSQWQLISALWLGWMSDAAQSPHDVISIIQNNWAGVFSTGMGNGTILKEKQRNDVYRHSSSSIGIPEPLKSFTSLTLKAHFINKSALSDILQLLLILPEQCGQSEQNNAQECPWSLPPARNESEILTSAQKDDKNGQLFHEGMHFSAAGKTFFGFNTKRTQRKWRGNCDS